MGNKKRYLVNVLNSKSKKVVNIGIILWVISQIVFWVWWLQPGHIVTPLRFIINSLHLAWSFILPSFFFYYVSRMKKPNPKLKLSNRWRVAMVVTKAPSEPWKMVKNTLVAMLRQKHPHDTWLADEDPTPETVKWCKDNGVKISTRKGVSGYHRNEWPRRTKCKEGNLAYFYDNYGYTNYDFVSQLDADHVPEDGYLEEILKPFVDPQIGYVSAPSICDANAKKSWVARGRLYVESSIHGALEAGYSSDMASICIGSHYAVRTKALKEIGGLGPELAEDYSTSLLMQAHGWRGVHALHAIAHGDGPSTFGDCMTQEYQWSRSLVVILFKYMPKYLFKLPLWIAIKFLFVLLWYPLFSFFLLFAYLLPLLALVSGTPWVNVNYLQFVLFFSIPALISLFIILYIKALGITRPVDAKILSWETALFQLVRWPWVLFGVISAIVGITLNKNFSFKITPKGEGESPPLPIRTIAPYVAIVFMYATIAILINGSNNTQGYYYFVSLTSISYLATIFIVLVKHLKERKI